MIMDGGNFDLVVIGSGPAGQKGAISAAKQRKRAAIIDRKRLVGGVCVHTGTIPSKTLREAALYLSGFSQRSFYGRNYVVKDNLAMHDLNFRVKTVVARETEVIRAQLTRNKVKTFEGDASFLDPHTVEVRNEEGTTVLHGEKILIACGTRPAHAEEIPIDGKRIFDADQMPVLEEIPHEVVVVGAGVIGLEYASILAALGVKVTLLDQRPTLLDFVDREMIDTLCFHLRHLGTTFRLGEKVISVAVDDERNRVTAKMESGKTIHGEGLLYAVGRKPNTDLIHVENAGLTPDSRGRLEVNEYYQTSVPHIYAAGDVIGFPALASTAMEQGRLASCHMFGTPSKMSQNFPYGIYTVPEISMVGKNEEELTAARIPYEVGRARYEELAKGQMLGDDQGILKLIFDPITLKIHGVHVIGDRASEIIHIGQAVMNFGGTIEYFRDTVFNYPTLAEAYKVAALDGINKL